VGISRKGDALTKGIVQIVTLAFIFWLEGVLPFFEKRQHRLRRAFPNITFGILNGVLTAFLFSTVTYQAMTWSASHSFGLFHRLNMSPWMKGVLAFVSFDLWMYGWHRANHELPFLWRFHRVHHSDIDMDSTTALRFHAGEIILSSLVRLPVVALLGISFGQLALYEICLQPVILFHHSNVRLPERIDQIFRAVIVTPNMHRVHHSQVMNETNSNYSSIFSWWDRLVQTFQRREDTRTIRYGLPYLREAHWQSLSGMFKTPFVAPKALST